MKWILFYQTVNDRVKYMTDETYPDYTSSAYRKFNDSLKALIIKDRTNLQLELDTFHTVYLDTETGDWKRYEQEEQPATFEELLKLNPSLDELDKQNKEEKNKEVNLTKSYIDKMWDKKKSDLYSRYNK